MKLSPILDIWQGKLRGLVKTDLNGNEFYAFNGIPFAKPPIGHLRFLDTEPAEKWDAEKVYEAFDFKSLCFQVHPMKQQVEGSEDCLYLNVYTPKLKPTELLPVMIFVPGGGFEFNGGCDSEIGPELLVAKDVVLVTINYRVNIFGFFKLKDEKLNVTGNQGLKDQLEAFRWVNRNIEKFGGDPNNVTIFGESAGACSVHLHLFSSKSKNLFHKLILQSGCGLASWATKNALISNTQILMDIFNFGSVTDENSFLNHLRQLSAKEIVETLQKLKSPEYKQKTSIASLSFSPIIETDYAGAFLIEDPETLLKNGDYYQIPMIIGYNKDEGFLFKLDPFLSEKIRNDIKTLVPRQLKDKYDNDRDKINKIAQKIKSFYFGDRDDFFKSTNFNIKLAEYISDIMFSYDSIRAARLHSKVQNPHVYLYHLKVHTRINRINTKMSAIPILKNCNLNNLTVHTDDIPYLFLDSSTPIEYYEGELEKKCCNIITTLWTNFAKYSNPNGLHNEAVENCDKWLAINNSGEKLTVRFLDIANDRVQMDVDLNGDSVQFWDQIYSETF